MTDTRLQTTWITALAGVVLTVAVPVPAEADHRGMSALPGLERVSVANPSGSPNFDIADVYCPFGKSVLGAGGEVFGGRGQVGLTGYTHIERQWGVAYAYEDDDGTANNWSVTAYAICADGAERPEAFGSSPAGSAANQVVTVACPAGTLLTGGGASLHGDNTVANHLVLDDVVPSADLRSLRVEGFEDQDGTQDAWSIGASLRCSTPLPGQRRVAAVSSADSVTSKGVVARCPAGQRVIGTGSEIVGGRGQVVLDDVLPSADLTSVRVEAFEDQDGTTSNWSVTAYAICADQ